MTEEEIGQSCFSCSSRTVQIELSDKENKGGRRSIRELTRSRQFLISGELVKGRARSGSKETDPVITLSIVGANCGDSRTCSKFETRSRRGKLPPFHPYADDLPPATSPRSPQVITKTTVLSPLLDKASKLSVLEFPDEIVDCERQASLR
ncbi:hypothetical protein YC2023_117356 [Brassica napus]